MIVLECDVDYHKLGRIVEHKVIGELSTPKHSANENCFSNLKEMGKNQGNLSITLKK